MGPSPHSGKSRQDVFRDYRLRVAAVLRDYGMFEREQAPQDSRVSTRVTRGVTSMTAPKDSPGIRLTVCEFPDAIERKESAWVSLIRYVREAGSQIVVLPEMPFCEWIFVGDTIDTAAWRHAVEAHDQMIGRLSELNVPWIMSSRPIERDQKRLNEAFIWSAQDGYRAVRCKWYLPNAPVARESLWFDQGDKHFEPAPVASLRAGFQLCSEMMYPEHARELGRAGAHLIAQPRAAGAGHRWYTAAAMCAVTSGSFVASANRRSTTRNWFVGGSWLISPEAELLAATNADQPFATVVIDVHAAELAKRR